MHLRVVPASFVVAVFIMVIHVGHMASALENVAPENVDGPGIAVFAFATTKKGIVADNRIKEAEMHFEEGKKLMNRTISLETKWGYWDSSFYVTVLDFSDQAQTGEDWEIKRLRDAIHAFETAISISPEHHEAMLYLAYCLIDPGIGEIERSNHFLQQIVSESSDERLKYLASEKLWILEDVVFSSEFADKIAFQPYFVKKYRRQWEALVDNEYHDWATDKDINPAIFDEILSVHRKCVLAACEELMWKSEHVPERRMKSELESGISSFLQIFNRARWRAESDKRIADHCQALQDEIGREYPAIYPHLLVTGDRTDGESQEIMELLPRIDRGEIAPLLPKHIYNNLGLFVVTGLENNYPVGQFIGEYMLQRDMLSVTAK